MSVRRRARGAYSLVEVVVALVILAIGLLGSTGLVVTAARSVAEALRIEAALTLAEGVADSLTILGWQAAGERRDGAFLVSWSGSGGWGVVTVRPLDGPPLVDLVVPVLDP
jgi:prepilin-type N-terminal cleavage/methylation domain-containing protein